MPVVRTTGSVLLLCALLLGGCRATPSNCPQATVTADPQEIPDGTNETDLIVTVSVPGTHPELDVITKLTSVTGTIADPFALETTFVCDHDVSGPVEICVNTTYRDDNGIVDGVEAPNVDGSYQYIRQPHVRLYQPLECTYTSCIEVTCPEIKNQCPVVSSLTIDPMSLSEGETATIEVVAEDPDDNPEALSTTLMARYGNIADPTARRTSYTCDPDIGGADAICVVASDGNSSCDAERCTWVRCPGDPLENFCPIIEDFTANPNPIPSGEETTTVRVDAVDPDEFPEPLQTTFIAETGAFEDPHARETTFHCGEPGDVEVCVVASDGDPDCAEEKRCITVRCPTTVVKNVCPNLNNINALKSVIPLGETSTPIETRGWDTDRKPFPLVLTLSALWGTFENTENLMCEAGDPDCLQSPNVVFQNATYICDRPDEIELCVEATDGLCSKKLCTFVTCPSDIPTAP
jgi:hypothetical protein